LKKGTRRDGLRRFSQCQKFSDTDPPTYKITDANGEEIQGTFYEQEMQKTHQDIFRIEKVIRRTKEQITGQMERISRLVQLMGGQ
jgi:hypothetical protein